jgi:hypothetical protein
MRSMFKRVLLAAVVLGVLTVAGIVLFREKPIAHFEKLASEQLDMRAQRDADRYKSYVTRIRKLEDAIKTADALFDRPSETGLSADERRAALELFEDVIDHSAALDQMARWHLEFWKLSPMSDRERHARHFALFFAAYVEKLALGVALIDRTINKPQFEKLFDEGNVALGISPGAYQTLKWNVIHVDDAARALAAHQWLKVLGGPLERLAKTDEPTWGFLMNRLEERYATVKENLTKKSVKLFGGNTVDIGKDVAHTVWFPVQTDVATWMGDTKVRHLHKTLISHENVLDAVGRSEPGDILVERRNWYLSNVGLPGFWPHAALYLGTTSELAAYFHDPEVDAAYPKGFAAHLEEKFPAAWGEYASKEETDHGAFDRRVIEAMSEGVVYTSAEHSIGTADYVAAMRPKLSKLEKAKAIERAFGYAGRPYDFDFDFYTDSSLVCSELVFKAYEPREGVTGVTLPLEKVVGRMTLGPNTIVKIFDQTYGSDQQQLAFAWFIDGFEKAGKAEMSTVDEFRASYKRPKWDVSQK